MMKSWGFIGAGRITRILLSGFKRVNQLASQIVAIDINPDVLAGLQNQYPYIKITNDVAEEKIEAYAMIIAMGLTYFWFQWQHLFDLGKSFGLSEEELQSSLPAMVTGAVQTLFHSGLTPEEVINLIPVKPLAEDEAAIKAAYQSRLTVLYQKLKG